VAGAGVVVSGCSTGGGSDAVGVSELSLLAPHAVSVSAASTEIEVLKDQYMQNSL